MSYISTVTCDKETFDALRAKAKEMGVPVRHLVDYALRRVVTENVETAKDAIKRHAYDAGIRRLQDRFGVKP